MFSSSKSSTILKQGPRASLDFYRFLLHRLSILKSSPEEFSLLEVLGDEYLLTEMKQSESSSSDYFSQHDMVEKLVQLKQRLRVIM